TGKLGFYEKLINEVPESLLHLLSIQGLGPKKVAVLFQQLGITTIVELRKACVGGKLRDLEGFGEITERNILRGITIQEKTSGRALLHIAHRDGLAYQTYLGGCPAVIKCSIAGSLRRMKETIGDIDVVVASDDPDAVMNYFTRFERVDRVLLQGSTKTSVVLDDQLQVDVRVVEPKSYGAALQYFTGSKEHNVKLRSLAIKQGYKLNEYGVFSKDDASFVTGADEADVYTLLGLQFIPPELRENRGEVELAQTNELPNLVNSAEIIGDFHVHSTWSDGNESIERMAVAAQAMGYSYVGITDHSQTLRIANGLSPERVKKKRKEIERVNKRLDSFRVLCGTECDIRLDGTLDYPSSVLQEFDFVYLGVHTGFTMTAAEMTKRVLRGMDNSFVDFLAHPTCRMIGRREGFDLDMGAIMEKASERGIALEINAFPDRLDLNDVHVKQARDQGLRVVVGTDSHSVLHLGFMQYGVATARRGWCTAADVLNTRSLSEVETWLQAKR
ncbi:MAG: DNA polymerase/3'-5' exonuclease PolX, partial [Candidatus Thermoplasmatota archaeon]|nr:DNA polymerase/3'-5' exonuclease PolX [Candidatus Thermoplasmatota archaeon]